MGLTTPKMSLSVWNHLTDPYDHAQLADNFSKLDFHDHSPGRGVLIPTEGIAPEAITADKIAPGVLDTPEIVTPTAQIKTVGQDVITSGTYVNLGIPDQITLDVPEDSLVFLWYGAQISASTSSAASAGIFVDGTLSAFHLEAEYPSGTAWNGIRTGSASGDSGLVRISNVDVGVSQVGTPIVISNLTAGLHAFSIRYKRTSGTGDIRVKNRVLRVWAQAF